MILGVWILAAIIAYRAFAPLGPSDWSDVLQPEKTVNMLLGLAMILGFFAMPSLVVSGLFAALLYWVIRRFPQRGTQKAVLFCNVVYAGWSCIWAATADQEATSAYGIQILLVPILSFICLVAGRTAANSDL